MRSVAINLKAWLLIGIPAWLVGLSPTAIRGAAANEAPPLTTVATVDLDRYVGLWYEIAKIPNRFQNDCVRGATAEYALRDDGKLSVLNRCAKKDGSMQEAEGIAKIEDPVTNAKLKVSFVSFLGWRPFWGDYWIVGLDEGYQWVVVGTPSREYGWILARTPRLDAETMDEIYALLESKGYRSEVFVKTLQ